MELFNKNDIENLITEIYYYMEDNRKLPDSLSKSFLRAEKEIEESEKALNELYLLFSQRLYSLKEFKEKGFKSEKEYIYFASEYKYLTKNFEKLKSIKSSLKELNALLSNTVLDTSKESFKYGFLAHKELNKSLNI